MKFGANIYFNENIGSSFMNGYQDGDPLKLSVVVMFPDGNSPEEAANVVFHYLNADDRPNGQTERSLSVGDVVKIIVPPTHEGGEGEFVWLACENLGWRRIQEPT